MAQEDYTENASLYDDFDSTAVTLLKLGYPMVTELLGEVRGQNILDYGCGTGIFSRMLAAKGAVVKGVDTSADMIRVANSQAAADLSFSIIESGNLSVFPDATFDSVVANFVLCTLSSRKEIHEILTEIRRVLKPGGHFIFLHSNWDKSGGKEFVSFRLLPCEPLHSGSPVICRVKSDPPIDLHDFFWSVDDYYEMAEKAGLRIKSFLERIASNDADVWMEERFSPPYYAVASLRSQ